MWSTRVIKRNKKNLNRSIRNNHMDKLIKILDKLIPLFSTLLGAYITYIVTTSSKKNEIKINSRIEARDDYWIPLAIAIQNLQKK